MNEAFEKLRTEVVENIDRIEKQLPSYFDPSTKPLAYSSILMDTIRSCSIPMEIEMSQGSVINLNENRGSGACDIIVYDQRIEPCYRDSRHSVVFALSEQVKAIIKFEIYANANVALTNKLKRLSMWTPALFLVTLAWQEEQSWLLTAKQYENITANVSVFNLRIKGELESIISRIARAIGS